MRIAVIGAGAIGCYVAGRLASAGADVTLVARGRQVAPLRANGIRITGMRPAVARPVVLDATEGGGPFDLVITAVKAYSTAGVAGVAAQLAGQRGRWLCIVNGIPWWYGSGAPPPLAGIDLQTVDPVGVIRTSFDPGRVIGSAAYLRCEVTAPGEIDFSGGRGLDIGSITGSEDLEPVTALLNAAGIGARTTNDIRSAVWNKLLGNVNLNPLSVVTGMTVAAMLADPAHRATILATVQEAQAIMRMLGCVPECGAEERVAGMEQLGPFRSSMLQDADAGRPLEIDAIIGAPLEIAARIGIDMPVTRRLDANVRYIAQSRGLMP